MKNLKMVVLGFGLTLIAACGGGGGGNDSANDNSDNSVNYTGLTTQATVTEDNSAQLTMGAYQNGAISDAQAPIGVDLGAPSAIARSRGLALVETTQAALKKIDFSQGLNGAMVSGVQQTVSKTIQGPCGGTYQYTISVDDATGIFTADFVFNNYCEDGDTLNGSMRLSGAIDLTTLEIKDSEINFNGFTITVCGSSFVTSGKLTTNTDGVDDVVNMDLRIRQNNSSKVYWLNNFEMRVRDYGSYQTLSLSGRYYDPDYGYVDISTETPLRIDYINDWPTEGVFVIRGRTINGNATYAHLTATANGYEIEADTTGDGQINVNASGTWSSNICTI